MPDVLQIILNKYFRCIKTLLKLLAPDAQRIIFGYPNVKDITSHKSDYFIVMTVLYVNRD